MVKVLSVNGKIPLVDGKAISATGGSSVPKPLTYDYMPEGYPTKSVQTTTLMEEQTVEFAAMDGSGLYAAYLTEALEIVEGQTYTVKWDGTEYECICYAFDSETYVLGNLSIAGAGDDTGEPFIYANNPHMGSGFNTLNTSASHNISVKKIVETVTPMAEEYLPENIATNSDVEATQKVLDGVFSSVATFTFDKQTSGRDTFVFNSYDYYKISDFNPAPEDVISFKGTSESGEEYSEIIAGNNCVGYGSFIVVASAGHCSLAVDETTTFSFTAPSAGLYAIYEENNAFMTAGTAEFTLKPSSENYIYINGLFLKSSTADSTKKFKITVDDSGTISATGGGGGSSTVELDTTLSEAGKAADAKAVGDALAGKVDKVTGKGLSTNDYTDAAKAKVDALAPVATSGSYNDLTNKPTIPAPVTEQTVSGWGFTKNTGTYSKPTGGIPKADLANDVQASLGKADSALQNHQDLSAYAKKTEIPTVPTKVSAFTNDSEYQTAAQVNTLIDNKLGNIETLLAAI